VRQKTAKCKRAESCDVSIPQIFDSTELITDAQSFNFPPKFLKIKAFQRNSAKNYRTFFEMKKFFQQFSCQPKG